MHPTNLNQLISRGLAFIASSQPSDGGFQSVISPDKSLRHKPVLCRTTLFASLIMGSLTEIPGAAKIQQNAAGFLKQQLSPNLSLNYWDRTSSLYKSRPYPDDLDDTFIGLAALWQYDKNFFSGADYASIVRLLTAGEVKTGGPYRTWLVNPGSSKEWNDVDIAVNTNVAYFLTLLDVNLPQLVELIDNGILSHQLTSPYYPNIYPILYFICRNYRGSCSKELLKLLADSRPNNSHDIALILSSLIRLKGNPGLSEKLFNRLLTQQQADGSWDGHSFCVDSIIDKAPYYNGSAAATTALCLEALYAYQQTCITKPIPKLAAYQPAINNVTIKLGRLPNAELRDNCNDILGRVLNGENDEQVLGLAWVVANACGLKLEPYILNNFSQISLWGWMAYTIYDSILDKSSDTNLLPGANVCLRNLTSLIINTLPNNQDFQNETTTIMDRLDAANAWEMTHCRNIFTKSNLKYNTLPDYSDNWQLADRSLGHTIAALGVLYAAGFESNSVQMVTLRNFCKHYLIARQLNDDAHDWEDDLQAGHINAAAVIILSKKPKLKQIEFKRHSAMLRGTFWNETIINMHDLIFQHTAAARSALLICPNFFNAQVMDDLLLPLENSASAALKQRSLAKDFIKSI